MMLINYLCPKHADWVYSNPEQALHVMARDEMQGTMLMQGGQLSDAIPYLGCAFDIAVILLEVDGGENSIMVKKIMGLTSLLEEMRISVNPNGHFGFIRSLFLLLFRPCQFYLK